MQCMICEKTIKLAYTIDTIFDDEKHHICRFCYLKHPIIEEEQVFPIDGYEMTVVSLDIPYLRKNPLAYMSFYKPYIIGYITYRHHDVLLIFDNLNQDVFDLLDILKLGRIYALTLCLSID
jgi:hypothetical protein